MSLTVADFWIKKYKFYSETAKIPIKNLNRWDTKTYIGEKPSRRNIMKKSTLSLLGLIAALAILGLGSCRSIQAGNKDNRNAPDFHTTRISLSWSGPYAGSISSSGRMIDAFLYLNCDDTFELTYSYADIPASFFTAKGKFKWDKTESCITLEVKDFPPYYWVVSNGLIQLDHNGKVITGDKVENYTLKKMESMPSTCDF